MNCNHQFYKTTNSRNGHPILAKESLMMTTDVFVKCQRVISMQFFVDSSKNHPRERSFFDLDK